MSAVVSRRSRLRRSVALRSIGGSCFPDRFVALEALVLDKPFHARRVARWKRPAADGSGDEDETAGEAERHAPVEPRNQPSVDRIKDETS